MSDSRHSHQQFKAGASAAIDWIEEHDGEDYCVLVALGCSGWRLRPQHNVLYEAIKAAPSDDFLRGFTAVVLDRISAGGDLDLYRHTLGIDAAVTS